MIYSQPAQPFLAVLQAPTSGLTGTAGYQILGPSGSVSVARTTSGITEAPVGSGKYFATPAAPSSAGRYELVWDTGGTITPTNTASEDLVVDVTVTTNGAPLLPPDPLAATVPGTYASGTAGAALGRGAADPLAATVPGTYQIGTAGAALGRVGAGLAYLVGPVNPAGTQLTLIRGDDYFNADGRSIDLIDPGTTWPDLTGATVHLVIKNSVSGQQELSKTGTVVVASGTGKHVRFEPAAADTQALPMGSSHAFDVVAALASGHTVSLQEGTVTILGQPL